MQQVHLRFNDVAGKPLAVRVRVTDPAGNAFLPYGRGGSEADLVLGDGVWSLIDGACEISLPPGPLKIAARKGPEYHPLDADVDLIPGKMSMRFTMERRCDLAADGWHSGDLCSFHITPHAALLEAAASDLAVVDLLVENDLVNIAAYSGQSPALSRPGHMVVVNTANQGPTGRLLLLNTHRTVYPLSFAAGDKWSLADWSDQCHRKKGLVVADDWLIHPEVWSDDVLRRVDAVRFHPNVPLVPWFAALDRGLKLPLVAGSGKRSNRTLLGGWRTYANVNGQLDYASWIEAIRAGRTFVTNGPILRFTVNDRVVAEGQGRIEIITRGNIASADDRLDVAAPVGWFVIRCQSDAGMAVTSAFTSVNKNSE